MIHLTSLTRNAGSIVVIIEPTPRSDAAVVVMHDPLHALDIPIDQVEHFLRVIVAYLQFTLRAILSWRISVRRKQQRTL